jgi:hypothetical protein
LSRSPKVVYDSGDTAFGFFPPREVSGMGDLSSVSQAILSFGKKQAGNVKSREGLSGNL